MRRFYSCTSVLSPSQGFGVLFCEETSCSAAPDFVMQAQLESRLFLVLSDSHSLRHHSTQQRQRQMYAGIPAFSFSCINAAGYSSRLEWQQTEVTLNGLKRCCHTVLVSFTRVTLHHGRPVANGNATEIQTATSTESKLKFYWKAKNTCIICQIKSKSNNQLQISLFA